MLIDMVVSNALQPTGDQSNQRIPQRDQTSSRHTFDPQPTQAPTKLSTEKKPSAPGSRQTFNLEQAPGPRSRPASV